MVRIEFSRRGGKNPDEVITFPAPGVTLRERDTDGDGFFEERRLERKDKDVLVERRTKDDSKWRSFEKETFDLASGEPLDGPAVDPVPVHPVRARDGWIEVAAPETP